MYIVHCVYQSSLWLLYEIKPLFYSRFICYLNNLVTYWRFLCFEVKVLRVKTVSHLVTVLTCKLITSYTTRHLTFDISPCISDLRWKNLVQFFRLLPRQSGNVARTGRKTKPASSEDRDRAKHRRQKRVFCCSHY